ncbi:hypothetical protein D3C81_2062380 [compost metagenome]
MAQLLHAYFATVGQAANRRGRQHRGVQQGLHPLGRPHRVVEVVGDVVQQL